MAKEGSTSKPELPPHVDRLILTFADTPPLLLRTGVLIGRVEGGVGIGAGAAWKFEAHENAATEEGYWRPMATLDWLKQRDDCVELLQQLWAFEQVARAGRKLLAHSLQGLPPAVVSGFMI